MRSRAAASGGQATLETVATLPLLVLVVLAVAQLLAAGVARELADHAAEAGAVALLERGDPATAARAALPGWARGRLDVDVSAGEVRVVLRPPAAVPAVADLLAARARAVAR